MKQEFVFSEEFGRIDERLVESAGGEWKGQKRGALRLYGRRIACAALVAALGFAMAGNSSVQAAVRRFTTKIGEILGFKKDLSSYTEIIDQTQTVNGISLTLKEVIVDDRVLIVSIHTDMKEGGELPNIWINDSETLINDRWHMSYDSITLDDYDDETLEQKPDTVLVETYEDGILEDGSVKLHLVLEAGKEVPLPGQEFDSIAEFAYDFVITPEELTAQTVKRELDVTVKASDDGRQDLTLKELSMNDLYCRILATGVTWNDSWPNRYEMKLAGTDSLGNPVSLIGSGFVSEKVMRFETDFLGDYEAGQVVEIGSEEDGRKAIPDKNCEYLDLQLYEREIIWSGTEKTEDGEMEFYVEAAYSPEDNYGWKPVGEPFRVNLGGAT